MHEALTIAGARSKAGALCLVLALVAGCATQGQAPSPAGPVVDDIKIKGNEALSDRKIKQKILTSETGWWPFAKKRHLDPADWQADLRRIERLYQTQGFYNAQVVKSDIVADGDKVDLEVVLAENQPVKIGDIEVSGLEALPPPEAALVMDDLPVIKGENFREGAWAESKTLILRRLRDFGFATARLDAHAIVDVATQTAKLVLTAHPGTRYRFGEVIIRAQPDARVNPYWITEQVRLAIGWDQLYSDAALEEAQKRIFAMAVFSTARVTVGRPDRERQLMPVIVEVREGPTHTLRLGAGGGIDQVRQEVRGVAEWTDRNFFGGLRRLQTRLTAGWAFIPSFLAVARNNENEVLRQGPIYRAGVDFEQPRLLGWPSIRGRVSLESRRTLEQTYDAIGGRALAGITWQPHSTLTIFPSYNTEVDRLSGTNPRAAQSAPLTLGCTEDPCLAWLSYLEEVITFDRRDNALEPRRGQYLSLSLQQGGGPLGGDFNYFRVLPEVRAFHTIGEDDLVTFAARLRVGSLITTSSRPEASAVVTRFYAGGALSMRGFAIRRLSPLTLVPIEGEEDNPDAKVALPIGGNGLIEGSFEVRGRVSQNLLLAGFTDFGSVTTDRLVFRELPRMLWAVGVGLRYLTPVGPLRIDFAYRLPVGRPPPLFDTDGTPITYEKPAPGVTLRGVETGANVNRSCFGIGGSADNLWVRDGACAFHISIGEAF